MLSSFIIWDGDPHLFSLGSFSIRWYSLLFVAGFVIGHPMVHYIYRREGKPLPHVDLLTLHIMLGTIIGARLGHVLFYDFAYYSQHPLESILPVVFEPHFQIVGFQGLASHGAAIGIFIAIYLYVNYQTEISLVPPRWRLKRLAASRESYVWVLDRIVIFVALAGCLIRTGNFMNSEILGKPTQSTYGVVFAHQVTQRLQQSSKAVAYAKLDKSKPGQVSPAGYPTVALAIGFRNHYIEEDQVHHFLAHHVKPLLTSDRYIRQHLSEPEGAPLRYHLARDRKGAYVAHITTQGIPRHPAQLYEALSCLLLFGLLLYRWWRVQGQLVPGTTAGLFMVWVFGLRFAYEFLKEGRIVFETILPLNISQWLSIPLVLAGTGILLYARRRRIQ